MTISWDLIAASLANKQELSQDLIIWLLSQILEGISTNDQITAMYFNFPLAFTMNF